MFERMCGMPKKIAAFTLVALSMGNVPQPQMKGTKVVTVNGQVVDSGGIEIADAQVAAFSVPVGSSGVAGSISWMHTDDHGRFRMNLQPGRYIIRAKAEQAGYPNPDALLSADSSAHFPTVSIEHSDISGVVVVLGKKGAVLEGYAYDAKSKTAIAGTTVTLLDARNPKAIVELTPDNTGYFEFTVPSKPIAVFASAPGYRQVRFAKGQPLTLQSGEHRSIVLELERQ